MASRLFSREEVLDLLQEEEEWDEEDDEVDDRGEILMEGSGDEFEDLIEDLEEVQYGTVNIYIAL